MTSETNNAEPPRRMTPTERVYELGMAAIVKGPAMQDAVTLKVENGRVTGWDVRVHGGDGKSAADCASEAARVHGDLLDLFPPAEETGPIFDSELARNAKGETQIKLSSKTADPEQVAAVYENLRARYPLLDGTTTHDAPKQKASTK